MKVQDELFDFIHVLTSGERGYFRKYAALRAGRDSDNLSLFGIIEKSPSYDEQKIKKQFAKASGKKGHAQYNYRHHYLYQLILQSLHDQYAAEMVLMDMNVKLNEIFTLFSKAQYRACDKLVRKTMETAERLESYPVLIQLFQWRQKLMLTMGFEGISDQVLDETGMTEQKTLCHYAEVLDLSHRVNVLLLHHSRVGIAMSKGKTNLLKSHEADLLRGSLKHCADSPSVRVRVQYYYLLATIAFMKQDNPASLKYLRQGMDILLVHTEVYEGEEQKLLSWLCNLLTVCIDLGEKDLFDHYLDEMKRFVILPAAQKNYRVNRDGAFFILLYALYAAISLDRPEQAKQIATETEQMISVSGKNMDHLNLLQLYVHLSALLVMDQRYKDAYIWLQKLQDLSPTDMRRDIRATARFLEMIIHYEAGDLTLLESVCRSAERQFKTIDNLSEADRSLLSFFKNQLPKLSSKKKLRPALDVLCGQLDKLHAEGNPAVDYIEKAIHHWRLSHK